MLRLWTVVLLLVAVLAAVFFWFWDEEEGRLTQIIPSAPEIGEVLDTHREVPVHYNGKSFKKSHASRYSDDGYY